MTYSTKLASLLLAAAIPFVQAQTTTDCDPLLTCKRLCVEHCQDIADIP
jgi:hypothetical protein